MDPGLRPEQLDRSRGDIHAAGNPHVHLDPHRLLKIAEAFARRLQQIDPGQSAYYAAQLESFRKRWLAAVSTWEQQAAPLKGSKVVVHHKTWSYLLAWLGMEAVADLEPKPGIPPTSGHLATVLQVARAQQPGAILLAAYQNDKGARWLSEKSGVPVLVLPYTPGGSKAASDLFGLYEETLAQLLKTLSGP